MNRRIVIVMLQRITSVQTNASKKASATLAVIGTEIGLITGSSLGTLGTTIRSSSVDPTSTGTVMNACTVPCLNTEMCTSA
jgi:hypothetical protein